MVQLAKLDSRAVLAVTGPDARSFLQGLLTQDVATLAPGELRFAALLTPQGKLLYDLFLLGREDGVWLDCAADKREELARRLALYRLRAKAEIVSTDVSVSAEIPSPPVRDREGGDPEPGYGSVPGNHDLEETASGEGLGPRLHGDERIAVPDPRLAALGRRRYGPSSAEALPEADYHARRLSLGVPDPAVDAADAYPIEANFDLLHAIDFKKGCFVGQETTSRMKRRGQIKNRMLPIAFDGPPPAYGAEVLAGDLRAGEVRSGREGRAMALLRLDRIEGASLSVDGRPVRVERPAWFDAALQA